MARLRAGLQRSRSWAALALATLAALLLVAPMLAQLADREWPQADEFQSYLDSWARVLAPVEELVPAGEVLEYACPLDERGQPVADLGRWFDFIQAVLAPRRITRQGQSRYLLVHPGTSEALARMPGLEHTRVLKELAQGVFLLERMN